MNQLPNLENKNVLLIGGAGFIGHNMALKLNELGAKVTVLDGLEVNHFVAHYKQNLPAWKREMYLGILKSRMDLLEEAGVDVVVQDARDYQNLSKAIGDAKPDVVVMLAAVAHANRSNKDPFTTFDHSTRTLENALDASRGRVDHFIYFSSSMVYGDFEGGWVDEDRRCEPKGIYGALKFGGEKLVIAYNQVFDLPYTIIRPSALYGERCVSGRVGQIFIEKALRGDKITVHGDGSDRLDFTYIDDLVQGVIRVIGSEGSKGQVFNLTYGDGRSIADLIGIIKDHFPEIEVEYQERDHLMPERGTLSVEKARNLIGYDPAFPIEEGFARYIKWYREFLGDPEAEPSLI